MKELLTVDGERFDFEMNMLFKAGILNIPILEISIKTVYLENNKSSHFSPLMDSIRIGATFLKFIASAFSY